MGRLRKVSVYENKIQNMPQKETLGPHTTPVFAILMQFALRRETISEDKFKLL